MKKTKIKCHRCGYEWETKSKLAFVSCPSCMVKVKNPNAKWTYEADKDE